MRFNNFFKILKKLYLIAFVTCSFFGCTSKQNNQDAIIIPNAYSLWYNRPSVVETDSGIAIGYINSFGEIVISNVSQSRGLSSTTKLHTFQPEASDHGSPTLIKVPDKEGGGILLVCFSNHTSPLYCSRVSESTLQTLDFKMIDSGRVTYQSLSPILSGDIMLMYTLQHGDGGSGVPEWRETVIRLTSDGGLSWSAPKSIINHGSGTFPYSTPPSTSSLGSTSFAYSLSMLQKKIVAKVYI